MEPRTPHSLSRIDDSDVDAIDRHRICHATTAKPRVFAESRPAIAAAALARSHRGYKKPPRKSSGRPKGNSKLVVLSALTAKQCRERSRGANSNNWEESSRFRHWHGHVSNVAHFRSRLRAAAAGRLGGELAGFELIGAGDDCKQSESG